MQAAELQFSPRTRVSELESRTEATYKGEHVGEIRVLWHSIDSNRATYLVYGADGEDLGVFPSWLTAINGLAKAA